MNPMYNLSDLCFFLWMFVSGKNSDDKEANNAP